MKLELSYIPPSTNQVYRRRGNAPGMYMTDEGVAFKQQLGYMAKMKWQSPPSKKPFMIRAVLQFPDKRRRDINNFDKLLFDSLEGIVFVDDSQVVDWHITKMIGKEAKTTLHIQEIL